MRPSRLTASFVLASPLLARPASQSPRLLSIPQFYFPQRGPGVDAQRAQEERLLSLLTSHAVGLAVDDLKRCLQQARGRDAGLFAPRCMHLRR